MSETRANVVQGKRRAADHPLSTYIHDFYEVKGLDVVGRVRPFLGRDELCFLGRVPRCIEYAESIERWEGYEDRCERGGPYCELVLLRRTLIAQAQYAYVLPHGRLRQENQECLQARRTLDGYVAEEMIPTAVVPSARDKRTSRERKFVVLKLVNDHVHNFRHKLAMGV